MSDNTKYIDVDHEDFEDAPKALRDAYKALRKQHETTTTEVATLRTQVASRAVGDVLSDKGFKNPKRVERDLLADGIDPLNKAEVESWLSENSGDYARADDAPAATPEQKEANQQLAAAHEQLNAGGELRSAADMSKWELAKSEITQDMTGAEVIAVYTKHGI